MDAASLARTVQYLAVAIVGGASLSLVRQPEARWPRGATLAAALAGAAAVAAWLWLKALEVADISALPTVAFDTGFGRAATLRGVLLLAAAACALGARPPWRLMTALGATAAATFAWSGHGAATDGPAGEVHLVADIAHALAATAWIGALPLLLLTALDRAHPLRTAQALRGFSAIGPGLVAVLVLSGAVNSWFLVGPAQALHLADSAYGRLLLAKLALFALMLGLAAANRWRLTPALERTIEAGAPPPRALVYALSLEMAFGAAVLALVGWMGTLPPPAHG